jgi:hypothetical protein
MIPCFTYFGTSYRPLASPIYQLSILLLLDYGWYFGLGLRCGRDYVKTGFGNGHRSPLVTSNAPVTDQVLQISQER